MSFLQTLCDAIVSGFGVFMGGFAAYGMLEMCATLGWVVLPWEKNPINFTINFMHFGGTDEDLEVVKTILVKHVKEARREQGKRKA